MYQKSEKLNFANTDRPSELEIRQKRTVANESRSAAKYHGFTN